MRQVFDAEQLKAVHEASTDTKTVVLRRCWSVVFDVNGNAPSNALLVSCASRELATQVRSLFEEGGLTILVSGKKHSSFPTFVVEGYEFDTRYVVEEDWQPDEAIISSLAELVRLADEECDTELPDGVLIGCEDDDEDDDEDDE